MNKGKWLVPITDNYAIGADSDQYTIKYRPSKTDKDTHEPIPGEFGQWKNIKFYTDLNKLVQKLKEILHREIECNSVQDIYDAADYVDQLFAKKHFKIEAEVTIK